MPRLRRVKVNVQVCFLSLSLYLPFLCRSRSVPRENTDIHWVIRQQPSQSSRSLPSGDLGLGKGRNETELIECLEIMNGKT
ncbi:hypothetical protein K443DRAFT_685187 [Laccaria amethystina LaAM-08-1]|uniref:Secreted protein n=1 Tax=Laccaria amethystina LaAM-08-1 TaxID=1095629 RepID=A0A0C9X8A1_9AGAR|nr:hypothetical protein K443DRAFT_685187 [Laccaria amethystina LaAM-08-1]